MACTIGDRNQSLGIAANPILRPSQRSGHNRHLTVAARNSYGYEQQDADRFAQWEVGLLKYDYCFAPEDMHTAINRYTTMGKALQKTGHPILYCICEWGVRSPWPWAKQAGGHCWRVTYDLMDQWDTQL